MRMKKSIPLILAVCLMFVTVFAGCTSAPRRHHKPERESERKRGKQRRSRLAQSGQQRARNH